MLRVATASDVADILGQLDSVDAAARARRRGPGAVSEPTADQIVSHMAGYMEMG